MRLALLVACALFGSVGAAQAATFEVADGASGDCSQGDPCGTIGAAITAARAAGGGPHAISVGAGTYAEDFILDNANDAGLTITGAGPGQTVVNATLDAGTAQAIFMGQPGQTVENLTVNATPFDEGSGGRGVVMTIGANAATIRDADLSLGPTTEGNADIAINVNSGTNAVIDGVVISTEGEATGVTSQATGSASGPDLVIRDSDIYGTSRGVGINAPTSTNVIERTAIGSDPGAERSLEINGTATVSSSLITGGAFGALVFGNVSLRGVTIDRGETGVVDPKTDLGEGPTGAAVAAQSGTHVFDSSIAVEQIETFLGSLTCTNSNFTATAESGPGCPSGPSRPQGNFASPLSALFFDAADGDFDLPASSPARDAGRVGLGPGESATDFLFRARVSGARHDQGAHEFPVPAAGGPPPTPGPAVVDRTAPRLRAARFSPATFAVGKGPTAKTAAKVKRGTIFSVRLSEPATVRIEFQRASRGRRSKGRCRKPTRKLRRAKRCTRYVKVKGAVLTRRNLPAGLTKIRFSGRIGRKALKPGRYRAVTTATDGRGNKSKPSRPKLRIVRR